jgi:hypothetical protein
MRFLLDDQSYATLRQRKDHTVDCFVRPGEYLHHMYVEGVKYDIARAVMEGLKEAQAKNDEAALQHLKLHKDQLDLLVAAQQQKGGMAGVKLLGDPPPVDGGGPAPVRNTYFPVAPKSVEDAGVPRTLLNDMILRCIYSKGRPTGIEISQLIGLSFEMVGPLLMAMRQQDLLDVAGQKGIGDAGYEYVLKPPRGQRAVEDALKKTEYMGPTPVAFKDLLTSIKAQTIKNVVVTRRTVREAFKDLVVSESVLNEIGPGVNSGSSMFLFGYPGNGKTSVAERITRLMGDDIYIPYAIEANGQIIKIFDTIVHEKAKDEAAPAFDPNAPAASISGEVDKRWVKIKRPVVVVGGELTLRMLDLTYNEVGKFYEAPFQMKANGGIFMIDDFGRQQVRPMDLLNRWIVPLEKKYDYLTTVSGTKLEIPFDQLLIFSTNLDPNQLADEAFLRRIKFKIEIRDPDEIQWRKIWELVCKGRKVDYDEKGLDYLVAKWFKPVNRPFRMCQPRDILDQMISIAKYNMESVTFNPDLIDAGCATYFVSQEKKDFGAKVRLE